MTADSPALRIAFAPGVTISKWTRRWQERHPENALEILPIPQAEGIAALHDGRATVSFVRLPVDTEGLSVIRLYSEVAVLVVSRDSELADLDSVSEQRVAQLDGVASYSPDGSAKDAVALVAAGVGSLRLPHSLARLHARKDVVAIPIPDAAETEIALVWPRDETTDLIEEFVGIVRGRTAASSRGNATAPTPPPAPTSPRPSARARISKAAPRKRPTGQGRKRGKR